MVPANALSRRHDHAKGLKEGVENFIGLPDDLFIRVMDTELREVVAKAQTSDSTAQEALSQLSNSQFSTTKWTLGELMMSKEIVSFMIGDCMFQTIWNCDEESFQIIMIFW